MGRAAWSPCRPRRSSDHHVRRRPAHRSLHEDQAGPITKQSVFASGVIAVLALFGVAWFADTFVAAYNEQIVALLSNVATAAPLTFALAIFILAAIRRASRRRRELSSRSVCRSSRRSVVVAMWQALSGVLFLPANGTQLAAVAVDQTGRRRSARLS